MHKRTSSKYIPAIGILIIALAFFVSCKEDGKEPPKEGDSTVGGVAGQDTSQFPNPPSKITNALAVIPADFKGTPSQSNFDLYSWLAFIALNWPADTTTCTADTAQSILGGGGPRVWETYLSDGDVYVPQGSSPLPWCNGNSGKAMQLRSGRLGSRLMALAQKTGVYRFIHQSSKISRSLLAASPEGLSSLNQAVGGVLTDQNGRFVRYEVRMNFDEYNYLVTDTLWSKAGQAKYTQPISFPTGPVGAIEIKAAWKVLDSAKDDFSRFYTIRAIVYNDETGDPSPGPNPVTMGLVGLHISHKTASQSNWLWSTFEHVDNTTKSFNNPNCPQTPPYTPASSVTVPCTTDCCPPNTQTAAKPYTELTTAGMPINKPVQVTRVMPIEQFADSLNKVFQKLLAGSVWANYQLIGTQWTGNFGGAPKPEYLANTVIETFIQGPVPPTAQTSSCISCHKQATTAGSNFKTSADFSFLMGEAQ